MGARSDAMSGVRSTFIGTMMGGGFTSGSIPTPSISYAGSPFAWTYQSAISTANVSNVGGAATSYAVQSGALPTGVSLNTSTGALTGTPTAWSASGSFTIRATGPGGTSDAACSYTMVFTASVFGTAIGWYDAADLSTLWQDSARTVPVAADGDPVGAWDDKSGNGKHLIQATAGNRPTYRTNRKNGKPAVVFDGANDHLTVAGGLDPKSLFLAGMYNNTSGYVSWAGCDTTDAVDVGAWYFQPRIDATITLSKFARSTSADTVSSDDFAGAAPSYGAGSWFMQEVVRSDTSCVVYLNGYPSVAETTGNALRPANGTAVMGAAHYAGVIGDFLNGDIGLLILYSDELNSTNRVKVESYIASSFALVTTAPMEFFGFGGDSDETLKRYASFDGKQAIALAASYTATTGPVRDPDVIKVGSTYWLCHTVAGFLTKTTKFAVASSTDRETWTPVVEVDCRAVSGDVADSRTWAPQWFVDSDESVHVLFAASATGGAGTGFQMYETHPTNGAMTTWSTPVAITGTALESNMIDGQTVKVGSTYYHWYKDETNKYIEILSSSAALTGYDTALRASDWAGWGTDNEGPHARQVGGVWYCFFDRYTASRAAYSYQTAGDWTSGATTWSTKAYISHIGTMAHASLVDVP